ncbi:MAG: uncharacterized protein KVP18_005061 [Porospora cf. gigantea A]|uniref:uncharacterized protein n=1 Tax=Porospora cf. gigantea A TaxID=2853593 RepID=UPI00355A09DB|nr:MAG: hypothetical protein KVP18_005061 [Porospora cf. gigantea A]
MPNLTKVGDLTTEALHQIAQSALQFKRQRPDELPLQGNVVGLLFFEDSTRTRCSFEAAAKRLGGQTILVQAAGSSSSKGESWQDTVRMMDGYCDLLVTRHQAADSAGTAAEVATHPVVSAGSGAGEHPTQALLDLVTILEDLDLDVAGLQARTPPLRVTFMGDLKYGRTVHSLTRLLARFPVHFTFVAPESLAMPPMLLLELQEIHKEYQAAELVVEHAETLAGLPRGHVANYIYMTRVQKERLSEKDRKSYHGTHPLQLDHVTMSQFPLAKILHPLPRVDELSSDLDHSRHCLYFEQAKNGVFTRMAVLLWSLDLLGEVQRKLVAWRFPFSKL